ncbi:MAG: DUF1573 domain-containing protein [Desulfuromonadaceae bacterium]|nr:DUF1573 domain-containing protein [Desulfuromonadaceae bacterium]
MRLLSCLVLTFLALVVAAEAAPVLKMEADHHDWGTVVPGQKTQCRFVFHNDGDETLVVEKVRST